MDDVGFFAPRSVEETLELLGDPSTVIVAGATSITILLKQGLMEPDRLVWVGRVDELHDSRLDDDGVLWLGAATTLVELISSPEVRSRHPMLVAAASSVGNPRVRSMATLGGGLVHADPRQDLLPALLASDARVRVVDEHGERVVALRDGFFRGFLETAVEDGQLVTHVGLPDPTRSVEAYRRFNPGSLDDYPTVSVAARVRTTADGEVAHVRLALGGVAGRPLLVEGVDDVLVGRRPTAADVAAVAELAREATDPTDDERGSAAYKTAMAQVWTSRVLTDLLAVPQE